LQNRIGVAFLLWKQFLQQDLLNIFRIDSGQKIYLQWWIHTAIDLGRGINRLRKPKVAANSAIDSFAILTHNDYYRLMTFAKYLMHFAHQIAILLSKKHVVATHCRIAIFLLLDRPLR